MAVDESLRERVARLEKEVADNSVLRRRVEELTDEVAQVLIALEDGDHESAEQLAAALRASI